MATMQERRMAPKGTPQEEMEAARRELEIVSTLTMNLGEASYLRRICKNNKFCSVANLTDDLNYL